MATILFAAAGAAFGSGVGGSLLGLSGAVIGRAAGATLGRAIDQRIIGGGSDAVEVGKLDRFQVMGASEGTPVPICWGRVRVPGQIIWASPFTENRSRRGGKGVSSPRVTQYAYSVSLAVALCEGEILGVGRVWVDGKEIAPKSLNFRVYKGSEAQLPDPVLEVHLGAENAPAFRGTAYCVFENLDLSPYGSRVPQLAFEVMRRAQGKGTEGILDLQDCIRAVAIIPGTGEYSLATQKIRQEIGFGINPLLNVSSPSGDTDFIASLDQLETDLPNCKAASLVVSWFGSDLRCANCNVQPKVESNEADPTQMPWRSGGVDRTGAEVVPQSEGRPIYGGTPADGAVIQAIEELRRRGIDVMFYPFVLMDQMEGNTLQNPYSDSGSQPHLPWRGRITLSKAPGQATSPDQTPAAAQEVDAFFGTAQVSDFSVLDGDVIYSGNPGWGYRRFILHYAHLCLAAGGVESFCIGSELRGLTQIRSATNVFPAVQHLIQLASDVRQILGPSVKISYAADWSEYYGYHVGANIHFHLDPLWASPDIDFIGIDNYWPISDWRDHSDHADSAFGSVYDLEYLTANILGGEGYDWHYSTPEAESMQLRSAISDQASGEDWIFRSKDIRSWWQSLHFDRIDGVPLSQPTPWIPQSKPFRFTEYGCAAIDKGTNEPNKFLDSRSSESAIPRSSEGVRDDLIQMQYYRAMTAFWTRDDQNPESLLNGLRMIDFEKSYAWAWDARPFPDFPRDTQKWIDGLNYARGHWLNGRASSSPLEKVVAEACPEDISDHLVTSRLFGAVTGYLSTQATTPREMLQPLQAVYSFDCAEIEGSLNFVSRCAARQVDFSREANVPILEKVVFPAEFRRSSAGDSVGRVRLGFMAADGSFGVSIAEANDPTRAHQATLSAEFPLTMTSEFAGAVASRWLAESNTAQEQVTCQFGLSVASLTNADTIELESGRYRIDRTEISSTFDVELSRIEPANYLPFDVNSYNLPWPSFSSGGILTALWMDLPTLTGSEQLPAPYLAITSVPWRSPAIVFSSVAGSEMEFLTAIDEPSIIGRTLTPFFRSPSSVVDRSNSLRVELVSGAFSSISLESFLGGGNAVAIGDGSASFWEILQFRDSVLVADRVFELSTFLRGQLGTNALMPDEWPIGSYIVAVGSGLTKMPNQQADFRVPRRYRVESPTASEDDDTSVTSDLAIDGVALRPYSVVHCKAELLPDNGHRFTWTRRSRMSGESWEQYEVPVNEDREVYLITVLNSGGAILSIHEVDRPIFEYSEAMRVADSATTPYFVDVSQLSMSVGPGPARRIHSP